MKIQGHGAKSKGGWSRATRAVWLRLLHHQFSINIPETQDGYDHIVLTLTRGTGQSASIDLSRLTIHELLAFKEVVLIATEVAEPIVRALDEKARDAHANGDDSDDRVYRGLPTLVVRRGAFPESAHNQSVLDGHQNALQGAGGQLLPGRGTAEAGGNVAEHVAAEQVGPDDDPTEEG